MMTIRLTVCPRGEICFSRCTVFIPTAIKIKPSSEGALRCTSQVPTAFNKHVWNFHAGIEIQEFFKSTGSTNYGTSFASLFTPFELHCWDTVT